MLPMFPLPVSISEKKNHKKKDKTKITNPYVVPKQPLAITPFAQTKTTKNVPSVKTTPRN